MTGKRAARRPQWFTLARRGYLYRVATAAGVLAAGYGWVSGEQLPLLLGLAGAILGTGTASAYSPTKPEGTAHGDG